MAISATIPAELRLVALCGRRRWHDQDAEQLSRLLAAGLDWDRVVREAAWHGFIPLVHHHLRTSGRDVVPKSVWGELHACAAGVALSNRLLLKRLQELDGELNRRGVQMISLKGPVLAHQGFGLTLRPCGDLDILVRAEAAEAAISALMSLGYESEETDLTVWKREWIRSTYETQFNHPLSGVRIDLHWRLYQPGYRLVPDEGVLWERSMTVDVEGSRFRTLGREDGLHFLAFHAARHDWEALRWLGDVAEFLRGPDVDWKSIERHGAQWRTGRMWRTTLAICAEWLGLELPAVVAQNVGADCAAQQLCRTVGSRWNRGAPTTARPLELPWRTLFYRALESRRDRARMVGELWMKSSIRDWRFCTLPRVLWPLYAVIRPLRVATHRGSQAYKKYLRG
jgi:hypothetical protein